MDSGGERCVCTREGSVTEARIAEVEMTFL